MKKTKMYTLKKFDEKKCEKTRKKLEKLLKQQNLTIEDLTPNYTCKKCQDYGTYGGFVCECVKKVYLRLFVHIVKIPRAFGHWRINIYY